jgi:hypothetical protein
MSHSPIRKQNISIAFGPGELLFWLYIVLVRAFCDVVGVRVCVSVFVLIDFQLIALLSVVFIAFVLFIRSSGMGALPAVAWEYGHRPTRW